MITPQALPLMLASGEAGAGLVDLLVVLACAAGVTMVLGRLRISAVPGYLIAGVLIGPNAFGLVSGSDNVENIAQLALMFLMFQIGMHLDMSQMKGSAKAILSAGLGTTLASAVIGIPIGLAFGLSLPTAAAIGMALSLSSTAVVLKVLAQRRELHSVYGRMCFGILLVQDLIVIGFLALLPALASAAGSGGAGAEVAEAVSWLDRVGGALVRIAGVALVIILGRRLLPKLMNEAARTATPEVLLVLAAALALAAGLGSAAVGLSAEMGAFVAGFLLSSTAVKHQLAGQLAPVRDLFMAVFFTAVGLNVDIVSAAELWWVVLITVVIMLTLKTVIIGGGAWLSGARGGVALAVGLTLAQAGEFSLVVLGSAYALGLVVSPVEDKVIAAVIIGLIVTPALISLGRTASQSWASTWPTNPWVRRAAGQDDPEAAHETEDDRPRVIVVGYGPVGRAVADRVEARGARVTILELNPRTVRRQRELGRSVVFGDSSSPEVLEAAGIENAAALVVTMPDEQAMLRTTQTARLLRADLCIAVRTAIMSRAMMAMEYGANHVTVEEIATAEKMAAAAFQMMETMQGPGPAAPIPPEAELPKAALPETDSPVAESSQASPSAEAASKPQRPESATEPNEASPASQPPPATQKQDGPDRPAD
ncbi:MAG: cation:proton antiporter [Planctomycetota bacterium]